jgi:hypothetical protein
VSVLNTELNIELRHIALTQLKNDTRQKTGIKDKRLRAGWDERYLEQLLFQTD